MVTAINYTLIMTFITSISYFLGLRLFRKVKKGFLNPLYTVSLFLIFLLPLLRIDYQMFSEGTRIFSLLLGTATVTLAVPLFKQWTMLKKNAKKIMIGITLGNCAGLVSLFFMIKLFNFHESLVASLLPKSVTIPVALSLSHSLGGVSSLTVLFVLISALFSLICGPTLLDWLGIRSHIAKGLALGTAAQALGTNRALQWSEEAGAMGSVGMSVSAVFICLCMPLLTLIV